MIVKMLENDIIRMEEDLHGFTRHVASLEERISQKKILLSILRREIAAEKDMKKDEETRPKKSDVIEETGAGKATPWE